MNNKSKVGYLLIVFLLAAVSCFPACRSSTNRSAALADTSTTSESTVALVSSPIEKVPQLAENLSYSELTWTYTNTGLGPTAVHITVPCNASASTPMPVLIALHGQGEARKPVVKGALGWPYDYGMLKAMERLNSPPLIKQDFGGMVTDARLAALNQHRNSHPWRGIIVVSPYIPDRFGKWLQKDARTYGAFITQELLPRVYKELPAKQDAASTAIDGVSLGGRAAIVIGLTYAEHFGAVGGIQAAFGTRQIPMVVQMLKRARQRQPGLAFRILSSKKDVFRDFAELLSQKLYREDQPHLLDIVAGNHSYEFNQGPGVYEMLLYYDSILRGDSFIGQSAVEKRRKN